MAHKDEEDEKSEEEENRMSFQSEKTGNTDPDAGSNPGSDSEDSQLLRLTHGSLDSGCTTVCFQRIPVFSGSCLTLLVDWFRRLKMIIVSLYARTCPSAV